MTRTVAIGLMAVLALARVPAASAQDDVELLGRIYGTRPPATYYRLKASDPTAFQFQGGFTTSALRARTLGPAISASGAASLVLGGKTVSGGYRVPVVLALFADSPVPTYSRAQVQAQLFDGPNPTGTISDLYREMSGGILRLSGDVMDWNRSTLTRQQVTGGVSGLSGPPTARVGQFIIEALSQIQGVDWGVYDNDGPDGIPNSGDDDGYVDVLAVIHPTSGAECGGSGSDNRIWSHKWELTDPVTHQGGALGQEYVTQTRSARGGQIRINSYTIQPLISCNGGALNEIGVMAHELGHGFGLPDLYGSSNGQSGTGRWDLMGTGAWGCSTYFEPARPCHMGAWSKASLGWVFVQTVPFGTDLGTITLEPVETGHRVLAIPSGDGSGEYYLLENRERYGFDTALPAPGLLVWQIDPAWIDSHLVSNTVNDATSHLGVWLRQADGDNALANPNGNRGDAGDPFPGSSGNTAFHASSSPASLTNARVATGVTLTDIALQGDIVRLRALARYQSLRVHSDGNETQGNLFTVDGVVRTGTQLVIRSAPYQQHTIEAAAGVPLGTGIRRAFTSWADLPGTARQRTWTTGLTDADLVARYAGPREVRFTAAVEGAAFGVDPGIIVTTPGGNDLWFTEGTPVSVLARATKGFEFRGWKGALAGAPNPAVLLMDQPRDAAAMFDLVFAIDTQQVVALPAATPQQLQLAAKNANAPTVWTIESGRLPDGLAMRADGMLVGASLETGAFPLKLRVKDALGLQATGTVTLQISVPVIGTSALVASFVGQPDILTVDQKLWLDRAGNANGSYDLGDMRAYVIANPTAPMSTQIVGTGARTVTVIDMAGGR